MAEYQSFFDEAREDCVHRSVLECALACSYHGSRSLWKSSCTACLQSMLHSYVGDVQSVSQVKCKDDSCQQRGSSICMSAQAMATSEKAPAMGQGVDVNGPCPETMQLSLRAQTIPEKGGQRERELEWRERALDLRQQLLDRREEDLDRREDDIRAREENLRRSMESPPNLRKLPCERCRRPGYFCGRSEPCYNSENYLLHHHHTCTECHDREKAQRRANRASRRA